MNINTKVNELTKVNFTSQNSLTHKKLSSPMSAKNLKEKVDTLYESLFNRNLETYFDKKGNLKLYDLWWDLKTPEITSGTIPLKNLSALKTAFDYILEKYPQLINQKPWFTAMHINSDNPDKLSNVAICIPTFPVGEYNTPPHIKVLVDYNTGAPKLNSNSQVESW
ncbi:MAG: hypothetical protein HYU63_01230 [Armatimonadetes bacterium]|nr:hypothetical protein [Armatimonadota bacterium]